MFPNCLLQNFLWCLPWKMPYGKGHYVTGCDLAILSNLVCVEQSLTNFSCNILGVSPKTPSIFSNNRKEINKVCMQCNSGSNQNCFQNSCSCKNQCHCFLPQTCDCQCNSTSSCGQCYNVKICTNDNQYDY